MPRDPLSAALTRRRLLRDSAFAALSGAGLTADEGGVLLVGA
jgi:hypothetical protein